MNKIKFLLSLHDKLSGLPQDEVEERLSFYGEMIEDRMEEGISEEEAVASAGDVDEIAAQIMSESLSEKSVPQKAKPKRRMGAWEIVLLVLGSPVWRSLLIAVLAAAVSLYAVLCSAVICLWAAFGSAAGCALYGAAAGAVYVACGNIPAGAALIGAGMVCAGLAVLLMAGCRAAGKGMVWLSVKAARGLKKCFRKKEGAR